MKNEIGYWACMIIATNFYAHEKWRHSAFWMLMCAAYLIIGWFQ
jgi:hypothetical protein